MTAIPPLEPAPEEGRPRLPLLGEAADEIDLRELLLTLWRRRTVVLGTVFGLTVLALVVVFQLTPLYRAETLVMIDTRKTQVVDVEAVLTGLPADTETIQSEILVIGSRGLAEKVIDRLGLWLDPEFNEELRPPNPIARLLDPRGYLPAEWLAALSGGATLEALSEQERVEFWRARGIDTFLEGLEVEVVGRSRVIRIAMESERPRIAARVSNSLAELYVVSQLETMFEATRRANAWLSGRVADLRQELSHSEKAVEDFRRTSGLVEGKGASGRGVTIESQQIAELNTQLVLASAERTAAEARLNKVRALIASGGGTGSVAEVLESRLIQRLREQEAEVARRAAELSTRYGERHPRMIDVRAEMRDLGAKIATEVGKVVQGLGNKLAVARARESSLKGSVDRLKGEVAVLNRAEIRLRALEREASANRVLFETFLARSKETLEQDEIQRPEARIISAADIPDEASFPRKGIIVALAAVGSAFLGIFLVFLIERFDRGFRSLDQIEQLAGVAPLGLVPLIKGRLRAVGAPEAYVLDRPASAYGEAIRSLHTSLLLSDVARPPTLVLIASALPREGKTAVVLSMARLMAKVGQKVMVLDCDLRRPEAHQRLGLSARPGLVELLAGAATLEEVVQRDAKSGLHLIAPGGHAPDPAELLGSDAMVQLLRGLAEGYDLVLIDSAPVLAVSDVRALARHVDKVVFLVRWAETRREVALTALRQLGNAGGDIAGAVLVMVDVKKHARYSYGDSGYYYGRVSKYYSG